ncbi:MAG: flagellar biosynthesis protein FlhG [Hydrogenophaga sp.]
MDPSVHQAAMRRQLVIQATPGCPAALAISQLADKIEDTLIKNSL